LSTSRYVCVGVALSTGNTAVSPSIESLVLDYAPLSVSVVSPTGGESIVFSTGSDTTSVTWSLSSVSGVDHLRLSYSLNGGVTYTDMVGGSSISPALSSFAWDMPDVSSSSVLVRIQAEDSGSVVLASDTSDATFTLVYDATAPTVSITAPLSSGTYATRSSSVALAGLSSDSGTGVVGVSTTPAGSVVGTSSWSGTVSGLAEGSTLVTVHATDGAGNIGSSSITVVRDTTGPAPVTSLVCTPSSTGSVGLSWAQGSSFDAVGSIVVRNGTSGPVDGVAVSVGPGLGGSVVYGGSDTSFGDTPVRGSDTSYTLYAYDALYNYSGASSCTVSGESANTAPTVSGLGPLGYVNGSTGSDTTPTLTFTTRDGDGDTLQYRIQVATAASFVASSIVVDTSSGVLSGSTTVQSYTTPVLSDGAYYWRVMATDAFGATGGWRE
jgi:hypothetical protein